MSPTLPTDYEIAERRHRELLAATICAGFYANSRIDQLKSERKTMARLVWEQVDEIQEQSK